MWVVMNDSFVSIVEHWDNPSMLVVRGRFAGDVKRFLGQDVEEVVTPMNDYRFRAVVPRARVTKALTAAARRIRYPNFKDSIREGFRKGPAMQTWSAWHRAQELQAYGDPQPLPDDLFYDELERDHDEPYEAENP